jgi:hypothetical protein
LFCLVLPLLEPGAEPAIISKPAGSLCDSLFQPVQPTIAAIPYKIPGSPPILDLGFSCDDLSRGVDKMNGGSVLWQVVSLTFLVVHRTGAFGSAFTPLSHSTVRKVSLGRHKAPPSREGSCSSFQRRRLSSRDVSTSRSSMEEFLVDDDEPFNETMKPSSKKTSTTKIYNDDLEMPWSEIQEWALRDKLPKYTVLIRLVKGGKETMQVCGLWRTMINEVTEIAGYPVEFLQDICTRTIQTKNEEEDIAAKQPPLAPALLPFLDEFAFTPSGGMMGNIYGAPGLADGTRIETSPVDKVQETLPKGYIRTMDGWAAYELGRPVRDEFASPEEDLQVGMRRASTLLKGVSNASPLTKSVTSNGEEDPDQMLIRLGASTGILLAGAVAVNMLSHHLTVNVFWV